MKFSVDDISTLNASLDSGDTTLKWAYRIFGDKIIYACSFGVEGIVVLHMINEIKSNARILFLDTHLHFQQTYDLIKLIKEKYPQLIIEFATPKLSLSEQAKLHGDELWKHNPDLCCNIRKIVPLKDALVRCDAWISGLRRDQSIHRKEIQFINYDTKFDKIKICPLAHWSLNDIWDYVKAYGLEYNKLHNEGYPSIGCKVCTNPVESGKGERSGRWVDSCKTECGIHK